MVVVRARVRLGLGGADLEDGGELLRALVRARARESPNLTLDLALILALSLSRSPALTLAY